MRLKAFRPVRVYEITLSREAQTLNMSRVAVPNLNQRIRVGTYRDGAASCGSKTLPWTAGMR